MRLVKHLDRVRAVPTDALRNAFATVPRHRFIPDVPLLDAYDDRAISIKERAGLVISSISQPSMIAHMLQLLDVQPGNTILEIGTGSGYTAALLGTIAGSTGSVVSVEIEDDLIASAREHLRTADVTNVSVQHADILPSLDQPFDRVIVTARHDDIDHQWWLLTADGGRMVVPLDVGFGGERAYGFVRQGERLVSVGSSACAFITLRGTATGEENKYFFRNRHARYMSPTAATPLHVVAMERKNAHPELLSAADVVIARPTTVFAFTF